MMLSTTSIAGELQLCCVDSVTIASMLDALKKLVEDFSGQNLQSEFCDIALNLFVELRKQACQLENEIDLKLVSFSKLGTNYRSVRDYSAFQTVAHRAHFAKYEKYLC